MSFLRRPSGAREWCVCGAGATLLLAATAATQPWLDRHFLPSFLVSRGVYVGIETSVRTLFAVSGILLILMSRRVAALVTTRALALAAAALVALAASELVLRLVRLRPAEWQAVDEEPRRQPDPRLGWTFVPARTGYGTSGGRTIEYTFDASGARVRRAGDAIDPERPSILFVGESVLFGDGLTYDESVPARVESMLGVQSVNLAVYGYSTDQAYLRLQSELPRFRHPEAVVVLFMTSLFGRNLDDDRPHLLPGLAWQPAVQHARLLKLAGLAVPFRRDVTVQRGIAVTREVLTAAVSLSRSRGAAPLVVVPQIGVEDESERKLRGEVLDAASLPYVMVPLDPAWHVRWDRHPDARAAGAIAASIAERLGRK